MFVFNNFISYSASALRHSRWVFVLSSLVDRLTWSHSLIVVLQMLVIVSAA